MRIYGRRQCRLKSHEYILALLCAGMEEVMQAVCNVYVMCTFCMFATTTMNVSLLHAF